MRLLIAVAGWLVLASAAAAAPPPADRPAAGDDLTLWYQRPAETWMEALPVGNGRLGGMVFGDPARERIQLNENTLWDGAPVETTNPEALRALPEVRRLLFAGKNAEATALAEKAMMGKPDRIKSYQTLGDLWIEFPRADDPPYYRRQLDLDEGIVRVRSRQNLIGVTRETFASYPDQVLVTRIQPDARGLVGSGGRVSLRVRLTRARDAVVTADPRGFLMLRGQIKNTMPGAPPEAGLRFEARVQVLASGGTVKVDGDALAIEDAGAVTLLLAAATSFRSSDPGAAVSGQLTAAAIQPYDRLRARHLADHRELFRRVALSLPGGSGRLRPTDQRLEAVKRGLDDPGLVQLYFQFGRYLLIASSRPGGLPANLQGLWNEHLEAPWNSDFHTNINLQMNYWPAEVANLGECHVPLLDFAAALIPSGGRTAKVHYGARGWVVHHLSNPWAFTTPADGVWGIWPMGAAWLAQHPWEHYRFSGDVKRLRQDYPVMKGATEFILDYLVPGPNGKLVTAPSHSPENRFRKPDGTVSQFTYGATMDLEIIHELFVNTLAAGAALGVDAGLRAEIRKALAGLQPLQISPRTGRLQEWIEDYEEPEPGHRHLSHLFAVHPGSEITLRGTPALAAAARKSLEYRLSHGGGHTGWSRAWIINFWARFESGDLAHENVMALLRKSTATNLFDLHPPFQIDGNFGGTAGIAEMLLQSHAGEVALLPALPRTAWPEGAVSGLRARGGLEVGMAWAQGRLSAATLAATRAGEVRLRVPEAVKAGSLRTSAGEAVKVIPDSDPRITRFRAKKGETYLWLPG